MPLGGRAGDDAAKGIEREVAGGDMRPGDADDGENHGRQGDAVHQFEQWQPEQVERDIAAEHRIGLAERSGVDGVEPRRPGRGRKEADEHRGDEGGGVDNRAQAAGVDRDDSRTFRRRDGELAPPEQPERQPEVQPEDGEHDRADRYAGRRLRRERLEEDLLVAELLEPEPVGVELSERRDAQ